MKEETDHFFFNFFFLCRVELITSWVLSSNCLSVPLSRGNTEKEKEAEFHLCFFYRFTLISSWSLCFECPHKGLSAITGRIQKSWIKSFLSHEPQPAGAAAADMGSNLGIFHYSYFFAFQWDSLSPGLGVQWEGKPGLNDL